MTIKEITPSQILDSRGEPTLQVRMVSDTGLSATFAIPSGASVGKGEAVQKRDEAEAFNGNGVTSAIDIINNIIAPKFIDYPLEHQEDFDGLLIALDGSAKKENLGANTILALSGAYFKLSAMHTGKPLWQYIAEYRSTSPEFPRLYGNIVGGGKHAPGLDVQEFMIIPHSKSPTEAVAQIYQVYHTMQIIMFSLYGPSARLTGDEGALAPIGATTEVVLEALSNLNAKQTDQFDIALDIAANSFFDGQMYRFEGQNIHASDLMTRYQDWGKKFGLYSLEDPFAETDLEGMELLKTMPKTSKQFLIVGDDFTVTNAEKITQYGAEKLFDGIIIKPDQVGSITEMFAAIEATKTTGSNVIISHRSGETNDDFIADLAYGIGASGIKLGAPVRGERVAKYNRLVEIERALNANQTSMGEAGNQPTRPLATPMDRQAPPAPKPVAATPPIPTTKPPAQAPYVAPGGPQFGHPAGASTNAASAQAMHRTPGSPTSPMPIPTAPNPPTPNLPKSSLSAPTGPANSFQATTQELNPALRAQQPTQPIQNITPQAPRA